MNRVNLGVFRSLISYDKHLIKLCSGSKTVFKDLLVVLYVPYSDVSRWQNIFVFLCACKGVGTCCCCEILKRGFTLVSVAVYSSLVDIFLNVTTVCRFLSLLWQPCFSVLALLIQISNFRI